MSMKHDDLIRRLCEASEGSAALSAEAWTALTGHPHTVFDGRVMSLEGAIWSDKPCLTTSLSAAWEEAERRGHRIISLALITYAAPHYTAIVDNLKTRKRMDAIGSQTHALSLCAALLAAEEEER